MCFQGRWTCLSLAIFDLSLLLVSRCRLINHLCLFWCWLWGHSCQRSQILDLHLFASLLLEHSLPCYQQRGPRLAPLSALWIWLTTFKAIPNRYNIVTILESSCNHGREHHAEQSLGLVHCLACHHLSQGMDQKTDHQFGPVQEYHRGTALPLL